MLFFNLHLLLPLFLSPVAARSITVAFLPQIQPKQCNLSGLQILGNRFSLEVLILISIAFHL